jgi:hypothetical protein
MRSRRSDGSSSANSKRPPGRRNASAARAVDKAQSALDEAEGMHVEKSAAIDAERDALEKRSQAEDARWEKQKHKLQDALRRARET